MVLAVLGVAFMAYGAVRVIECLLTGEDASLLVLNVVTALCGALIAYTWAGIYNSI